MALVTVPASFLAGCKEHEEKEKPRLQDEIHVELKRVASSTPKKLVDILPYDEALVWHEYSVEKVFGGRMEASVVRVAHWSVMAGKDIPVSSQPGEIVKLELAPFDTIPDLGQVAASDDLEITAEEPPRYIDVTKPPMPDSDSPLRYDYGGVFSDQMRLYWELRGQLRLVALGNSHATKGVCTREFLGPENLKTPMSFNLAPAGANTAFQCLIAREYVSKLPKLEWVVWVVSARNYNKNVRDLIKHRRFVESPGWQFDSLHQSELWPIEPAKNLVTAEHLKTLDVQAVDDWGWEVRSRSDLPADLDETRELILKQCVDPAFIWNPVAFEEFTQTASALAAKGVKVLVLTTPYHPFTKDAEALDPDRTSHEGMAEMVTKMQQFDAATENLWFKDFHNQGNHPFGLDEFYDVDHLNRKGAGHLSVLINEWMKNCN